MSSPEGGFERLTPYPDARECVRSECVPHGRRETLRPADSLGRVVASGVDAPRPHPHYDRVTADGYAVRAADTFEANERSPVRLVEGTAPLQAGEAVAVRSGTPVPEGATAVVRVAHTEHREDEVEVFGAVSVGANIAEAGSEVDAGDRLVERGQRLGPPAISLLQATDAGEIPTFERPQVAVVPAGEGLVQADPTPGECVETNGWMVRSQVEAWGGEAIVRESVADESGVRDALSEALDADVVVTTGLASVGADDVIPDVVDAMGTLEFHGVAIDPGRPVGFGTIEGTPVLLLPGSPRSAYLGAVQFLRPALALVGGTTPTPTPSLDAVLDEKLPSKPGTRTFARVTLTDKAGTLRATPLCVGSGCGIASITAGDGWIPVPADREGVPAGERVDVQQWE